MSGLVLEASFRTGYHRELASVGWLNSLTEHLLDHLPNSPERETFGLVRSIYNSEANTGPNSLVKNRFVINLSNLPPESPLLSGREINTVYSPEKQAFENTVVGRWSFCWRDDLLRRLLVRHGYPAPAESHEEIVTSLAQSVAPTVLCRLLTENCGVPLLSARERELLLGGRLLLSRADSREHSAIAVETDKQTGLLATSRPDYLQFLNAVALEPAVRLVVLQESEFAILQRQLYGPPIELKRSKVLLQTQRPSNVLDAPKESLFSAGQTECLVSLTVEDATPRDQIDLLITRVRIVQQADDLHVQSQQLERFQDESHLGRLATRRVSPVAWCKIESQLDSEKVRSNFLPDLPRRLLPELWTLETWLDGVYRKNQQRSPGSGAWYECFHQRLPQPSNDKYQPFLDCGVAILDLAFEVCLQHEAFSA